MASTAVVDETLSWLRSTFSTGDTKLPLNRSYLTRPHIKYIHLMISELRYPFIPDEWRKIEKSKMEFFEKLNAALEGEGVPPLDGRKVLKGQQPEDTLKWMQALLQRVQRQGHGRSGRENKTPRRAAREEDEVQNGPFRDVLQILPTVSRALGCLHESVLTMNHELERLKNDHKYQREKLDGERMTTLQMIEKINEYRSSQEIRSGPVQSD